MFLKNSMLIKQNFSSNEQRYSTKSCYTYVDCCMPIGKLCVLNALSTSDIPNTHFPAKDNSILFSVISTQWAGIISCHQVFL